MGRGVHLWAYGMTSIRGSAVQREEEKVTELFPVFSSKNSLTFDVVFKGCVHYSLASLFCKSKEELLWNKEKCFLFDFESSLRFWDN